ncbi:MAG: hypothetical protein KDF65_12185, partial [Anaerolineae bacterium]|nr:hypothetical protein [Anaerolineae bacterium]
MQRISHVLVLLIALILLSLTDPQALLAQGSTIRVPLDVGTLQEAINQISDGGIIELADGTYSAPANGFIISDLQKSFTIKAASGANPVLDGGGANEIITFINTNAALGRSVTFEGLTFRNGSTIQDGRAGGVTLQRSTGIFRDCVIENNNGNQPSSGGGGALVAEGAIATFINCTWSGNSAKNFGGGLAINTGATVNVANSTFTNNRTNNPGHSITAAGGGIHVGNARLSVTGSTFTGNEAGYVGGGVFAIGEWQEPVSTPRSTVSISDSTFTNNRAVRDPSVSFSLPTEGGAFHAEDQTTATISNVTFDSNSADVGGAVNTYRGIVNIDGSTFTANRAVGTNAASGLGGAISATSNDANDVTTNGGASNRRSAMINIEETIIRGVDGQSMAQTGGGIYLAGDGNRTYGINGVNQDGTAAGNRVTATLQKVIFEDTEAHEGSAPGTGVGGAIAADLADLTLEDTMILAADA